MPTRVDPPPLPGDHVGDFLLGEVAGVGGMATVYRAHSPRYGEVAVKILHPGKARSEEARRFRREYLALRDLDHPGVVKVYEAGMHGDYPWIAMEYVDGTDLDTLLEHWRTTPPPDRFQRVERLLRGLCEALTVIHERGMVHRDLKPSNVLVDKAGRAKLTDFGVVKGREGAFNTQLTMVGRLVGTVAFMSPEQISGEKIDARADLYSLGAVLYVMLTGQRPIKADTIAGYLNRHLTEDPRPPSELVPEVPPPLERICLRLLKKDPAQRHASAAEVLAELRGHQVRPPLHGRETEQRVLQRMIDALRAGEGGVLAVVGPHGSGRTTLLDQLVDRARSGGLMVGFCSAGRALPLEDLARHLPPRPPEPSPTSPVAVRLAHRTHGRPSVLVVDDVDLLPASEVEALTMLVRGQIAIEGEPLLVALSMSRTEGLAGPLATGVATGMTPTQLRPGLLDERAVVAIVRDRGLSGEAGAVIGTRFARELDGLPGTVVEQLQALLQGGWIARGLDDQLHAAKDLHTLANGRLPLPDSVRRKEGRRMARLGPDDRLALESLVVLGMESTAEMVAQVCRFQPDEAAQALDHLVADGLVRRWVDGVQEVADLAEPRLRDVVYGLMGMERRMTLHGRVATILRSRSRRRAAEMAEVIAGHLLEAGQPVEAFPLLFQAARRRLRADELEEALRLVEQATEIRPIAEASMDGVEVARWQRRLAALRGELLERRGRLAEAQEAWELALAAAHQEGDDEATARAQAGLGLIAAARGQRKKARADLEGVVGRLPQGDPLWPRVAHALARVRLASHDTEGAATLWRELETLGLDTQNPAAVGEALVGLGVVAAVQGRLDLSRDTFEQADFRLRDRGASDALAEARRVLAWLALVDGRLFEALDRSREAEITARSAGRNETSAEMLGLSGLALALRGDQRGAVDLANEATSRLGDGPHRGIALRAVLPVARALRAARAPAGVAELLVIQPGEEGVAIEDPVGLALALRASLLAPTDPAAARLAAAEAELRPLSVLPWAAAWRGLDLAAARHALGDPDALAVLRQVLPLTMAPGLRLLRLIALRLAARLDPDPSWPQRFEELLDELDRELGRPMGFAERWRNP